MTDIDQILADHQPALTDLEDAAWNDHGQHRFGVSYQQGYRRARRDVIGWVMELLTTGPDNLTGGEIVTELRKGQASVYWPLLMDEGAAWVDCDHCRTRQLIDSTGICPGCGTDIT
jgi:hypothetical protein